MLYKFCTRMMSNSDEFPGHGHKRRCEYVKFAKTGLARLTRTVPGGEGVYITSFKKAYIATSWV